MHPDSHKSATDENGQTSPLLSSNGQQQSNNNNNNNNNNESNNPRKDHYSYSYTYKTADPESGIPGLSSVEVNESVTEEIGPDGSKIIIRHQQEKNNYTSSARKTNQQNNSSSYSTCSQTTIH